MMNEKAIKSYADRLIKMTQVVPLGDFNPLTRSDLDTHYHFYTNGGVVYLLDIRKYQRELLKPLQEKEGWGTLCTEAFIRSAFRDILEQAKPEKRGANRRAHQAFTDLVTKVEGNSHQYTIYFPLSNIILAVETLTIGDVTLLPMTQELFEQIKEKLIRYRANEQTIALWQNNLFYNICASYTCYAHDDRAKERGIDACERALELLRFALQRTGRDLVSMTVGLLHEVPSYIRTIPAFSSEGVSLSMSIKGSSTPFTIDQQMQDQMEEMGVFKVADLFQQDIEKDSFHDKLLRGIHWFSNAQKEHFKENQFLNLVTCLETFLGKGENVTKTVTCGVAVVLRTTQEERMQLWKRMNDLYEHRSSLTHGSKNIVLDSDLEDLWRITGDFVACMIQRMDEFAQHRGALRVWIDAQHFAPGIKGTTAWKFLEKLQKLWSAIKQYI